MRLSIQLIFPRQQVRTFNDGLLKLMITAGIDAGSRSTKVAIFDSEREAILALALADQGIDQAGIAAELLNRACTQAGIPSSRVGRVVATGYGRKAVRVANTTITEITCHARGVHQVAPEARTVIEIGGQDSKCIFLEDRGRVRDFGMNDRCAAGSGRFLEVVASRLNVSLSDLGTLSQASSRPATISSTCVVFAETEIIGLLAEGAAPEDIAAGVQNAIASRVAALAGRCVAEPVVFTGGVALQQGMVRALEDALGCRVRVSELPQYTGALGAAILAAQTAEASL